MSNYISYTLAEEDRQEIINDLQKIKAKLSFCIKLSLDQKKSIPKMDDGRVPFVQKGLQFGKQEPVIVPQFTDFEEFQADLKLYSDLTSIEQLTSAIAEMVSDTRMAAGSDAYVAALSIYNSVKAAAKMGVPGTQAILNELKKLFEGQGNFKTPETK